jgi:hypothetical protein
MSDKLSVNRPMTPRRHSDILGIVKSKDYSSGLSVPRVKSAGNSRQSLYSTSSNVSLNNTISPPSPASGKKSVSFNSRVQLFDHATWKKQLKRYRKIARKLAKKEQALKEAKEKESDDSDDSSSHDEATKTEESSDILTLTKSSSRTPPRISIN